MATSMAMSNVAFVDFGQHRAEPTIQEVRVADMDNGYTRMPNEVLEAALLSDLTKNQMLILLALHRKTEGYNKKLDWVGNAQLEELTGIPATRCSATKHELIRMNVLITKGRLVGVNMVISEWETKLNGFCKTFTKTVKETFTETVKGDLQKPSNTKDNIQKTTQKTKPSSSQLAVARPDTEVVTRVISEAAVQTPNGKSWGTQDDLTTVEWIYKRVQVNNPTQNTPNWADWANTVRLMRQLDGRTHQDICLLFDWASRDEFWRSNVLSPAKLRKHWDTLATRMINGDSKRKSDKEYWQAASDDQSWADDLGV